VTFHDVISEEETKALVKQALPLMGKASIGTDKLVKKQRN
jgi:hypothetical protein